MTRIPTRPRHFLMDLPHMNLPNDHPNFSRRNRSIVWLEHGRISHETSLASDIDSDSIPTICLRLKCFSPFTANIPRVAKSSIITGSDFHLMLNMGTNYCRYICYHFTWVRARIWTTLKDQTIRHRQEGNKTGVDDKGLQWGRSPRGSGSCMFSFNFSIL